MANEHGGEDNITAVIVKIEGDTDKGEISLSDTLRDQPEAMETAKKVRAASEAAKVEMADTPPAGVTAVKVEDLKE
jgi:hypothetical protein